MISTWDLLFPSKEVRKRLDEMQCNLDENYDYDPLFKRYTPNQKYIKECVDEIHEAFRNRNKKD